MPVLLRPKPLVLCAAMAALILAAACQPEAPGRQLAETPEVDAEPIDQPRLETRADSIAWRIVEASGGLETFARLPYLRFDFSVAREGQRGAVIRHLWNRQTGRYRVEMPGPAEDFYVALFDTETRAGAVYLEGAQIDSAQERRKLEEAYTRFINDSYWLLAPLKLFDEGVSRTFVPDSSDAEHDVIQLTFDGVGLTPGDRYWLYADRETGRLVRWAYILQRDPGVPARAWLWDGYETLATPAGPLHLATRKDRIGDSFSIRTDSLEAPASVPDDLFTDPMPRLVDF